MCQRQEDPRWVLLTINGERLIPTLKEGIKLRRGGISCRINDSSLYRLRNRFDRWKNPQDRSWERQIQHFLNCPNVMNSQFLQ